MMTVLLYGELRRRFGRRFVLAVRTPAEAIRALSVQIAGFHRYFVDHSQDYFKVVGRLRGQTLEYDEQELGHPQSNGTLKIVPLIQGASAVGRLIGGAVMAIAGMVALAFGQAWGVYLIQAGIGMALGGVAELIAHRSKPDPKTQEKPENQPSYAFDGALNTTGQGGPVPLGYGRLMVGSQVISVGFSTNNEVWV